MKTLYLHIGIHRTGTTALQRNLAANRKALSEMDICYPFDETNHQDLAWALHRRDLDGEALLKRLAPYLDFNTIVLSGEDFCIHKNLDWLKPLKNVFKIRAIIYLRRQDHWLMSWYNQHIKWPFSRTHSQMAPSEFLNRIDEFYWINFQETLEFWASAIGKDDMLARVVESGQVEDSIKDFLASIGGDYARLDIDKAPHNDSLPVETLEFARKAGFIDMKPGRRMAAIRYLSEVVASTRFTGKTLFSKEQRDAILSQFDSSNRKVAEEFFGRSELFLEPPPDDRSFYQEGTLASNIDLEDFIVKTLRFIAQ